MQQKEVTFAFDVYESINDLSANDKWLLTEARKVTQQAYAPYSNFFVGAVARLVNGEVVTGSNQENASFPVGLCAERILLAAASSMFPNVAIDTLAISYDNKKGKSNRPISPCGICRQHLLEYESRFNHSTRIVLGGLEGEVYIVEKASLLLPLSFNADDLTL